MAAKKTPSASVTIAGFTVEQWKQHMDEDEDWTERLEDAPDARVAEVVAALDHADADVRGLACNLAYALGVEGLRGHAEAAVERLANLSRSDPKPKVKSRARVVHETLAADLQRAAIRRELPWLGAWDPAAVPAAIAALQDPREAVRVQVYLWWSNAGTVPASARGDAATALRRAAERETDATARHLASLAVAALGG
ncbi:MAG: hypothetical protein K1X88_17185 [Nannocystaceae bacterium]|nr:hypothetical protein [Nannocystaceae bacterium]